MIEYLEFDLLTYLHQFVWEGLSTLGGTILSFFFFFFHSLLRVEKELTMAFVNCSLLIVDRWPVLWSLYCCNFFAMVGKNMELWANNNWNCFFGVFFHEKKENRDSFPEDFDCRRWGKMTWIVSLFWLVSWRDCSRKDELC